MLEEQAEMHANQETAWTREEMMVPSNTDIEVPYSSTKHIDEALKSIKKKKCTQLDALSSEEIQKKRISQWSKNMRKNLEISHSSGQTPEGQMTARKCPKDFFIPISWIEDTPDMFLDRDVRIEPTHFQALLQKAKNNPISFVDNMEGCKFVMMFVDDPNPEFNTGDYKLITLDNMRRKSCRIYPVCGNHRAEVFRHMVSHEKNTLFDLIKGNVWLMRYESAWDYALIRYMASSDRKEIILNRDFRQEVMGSRRLMESLRECFKDVCILPI